jgi:N-formylglutamate amidohydrolase
LLAAVETKMMASMNAWEPISAEAAGPAEDRPGEIDSAFMIQRPGVDAPATPLIFASPHSGRVYPAPMMAASQLDAAAIRGSEDAWVDRLIGEAPALGARLIVARLARVWLDVNREAFELDPGMFEDELPLYARARTARVAAGLGAIARVIRDGQEIYARKLSFAEARARIEAVHRPYHEALASLIDEAKAEHGLAVLVDWHSMPSAAARGASGRVCDMVLGDRFGGSCAPALSRLAEERLEDMGYRVARNAPYAGGYTTEHYGRPARRVHALQIEINRALYMDEARLAPTAGFSRLKTDLESLMASLAAVDWKRI